MATAKEYISTFDLCQSQDDKDIQYKHQNKENPVQDLYGHEARTQAKNVSQPERKKDNPISPFKPTYVYGFNKNVPVLNYFSTKNSKIIFASGIYLVIYDTRQKQQNVLESHKGNITCISKSVCGNLSVSGCKGKVTHSIVVWDIEGEKMVQRISNPHGSTDRNQGVQGEQGVDQIRFTSNTQLIISIGGIFSQQTVCIWDWRNEPECPLSCVSTPSGKMFSCLNVHPLQSNRFLLSNKTSCIFFMYDETRGELLQHNPGSVEKEFGKSSEINEVLGGTNRGNLVTWVPSKPDSTSPTSDQNMKIGRLLRLDEEGISGLAESESLILVGGCKGKLMILNHQLQKLQWVQTFNVPKILSFSFRIEDENFERQEDGVNLVDFILTCDGCECFYFHSNEGSISPLIIGPGGPWTVLDVNPKHTSFVVAKSCGVLATYNYLTNERIGLNELKIEEEATVLKFSNNGNIIALGSKKGNIWLLSSDTLNPLNEAYSDCKGPIKQLLFSPTDEYLACSDLDKCITIYQNVDGEYRLLGRHRCHTKPISKIQFGINSDTENCVLFTIGKDMKLNEFHLKESSFDGGLKLKSRTAIEQNCLPTCIGILPDSTEEQFLVIPNDAHKIRLINMTTKLCRKILMSPKLEDHINNIVQISIHINGRTPDFLQYFVLQCGKFLALSRIPLSGYSSSFKTKLVSAVSVDEFAVTPDGRFCFTLNKAEEHVTQHSIDVNVMEEHIVDNGQAFSCLVSQNIKLYNDLKDNFSFIQVDDGAKSLSKRIPLETIEQVSRALGFYPTEKEHEDMVNEIKYSSFVAMATIETQVDVDTLFKVFMNHRPYHRTDIVHLEHAFNTLKKNQGIEEKTKIPRQRLFQFLKNEGETFKHRDFSKYLGPLFAGQTANDENTHNVPDEIDVNDLIKLLFIQ